MIPLFLEPQDVWLFRDGRPFDAGSQHRAESTFPPFPTVIAGAIRSFQLARRGVNLAAVTPAEKQIISDMVGTSDDLKDLRLSGPFVARIDPRTDEVTRYYPQPADAVSLSKADHSIRPASIPIIRPKNTFTSRSKENDEEYLLGLIDSLEKGETGLWLTEKNLLKYLSGETVNAVTTDTLFQREIHPGIGMQNATKTAQEGMLFEVEYVRPLPNVGLWVGLEGRSYQDWPDRGILQLGGETRAAAIRRLDKKDSKTAPFSELPSGQASGSRLRIYLTTPARFSGGWQPAGGWNQLVGNNVVLRAAAVNRFISMGGFDLAQNDHKAALRYVPAGSVYYFESTDGMPVTLHKPAFTDYGQEFGLGKILTGGW